MFFGLFLSFISAEIFLEDRLDNENWTSVWIKSEKHPPGKPFGRWQLTAGSTPGDPAKQRGLKTLDDFRNYAISRRFDKCWTDKNRNLVVQYTVKQDRPAICGGLYIKLLPDGLDQKRFTGGTPYDLMFGPDICHAHTDFIKLIISRNGTNFNMNQHLEPKRDGHTHLYTLLISVNGTFDIWLDGKNKYHGVLKEEFDYEGPKYIMDPYDRKPADWDDREWVPDPNDTKPADWDDRRRIPDPTKTKPPEWDDEKDGEWEPPLIRNPNFKAVWKPRMIPNVNYKGTWRPRKILNPDYSPDEDFGKFTNMCYLGIDIHNDNSGQLFDNFLVTDDLDYANEMAQTVFFPIVPLENEVYFRWGGHSRWEAQRKWGIEDFGRSKDFGVDANGNRFDDPDAFYRNTHRKTLDQENSGAKAISDKAFNERMDL